METLVLNGVPYVKASKAARDLGYTSDYVGQLCRSGHIDAHLVGRTWYVNPEQLGTHRVEKKRISRVKAREQARKSIEEHAKKIVPKTTNTYTNIAIHYESDENELIPQVRKITPASEVSSAFLKHVDDIADDDRDEKGYEVLNEGKKVVMSGKLTIRDASEDAPDLETVVMHPHIVRKSSKRMPVEEKVADVMRQIEEESVEAPSFMERLSQKDVSVTDNTLETAQEIAGDTEMVLESLTDLKESTQSIGVSRYIIIVTLCFLLCTASLLTEVVYTYTYEDTPDTNTLSVNYRFDTDGVTQFVKMLRW